MTSRSPARRAIVWLVGLAGIELVALTLLATLDHVDVPVLLLAYGTAFGAYLAIVLLLRTNASPVWIVLGAALFLRLPWIPSIPTLSDDAWRYLHDGRAQLAGINPFRYPPSAPEADAYAGPERPLINHPELPTVYPPGAQLTFFAAAVLKPHLISWKIMLLVFELALAAGMVQWLRARGSDPKWVAVYLLHPLPVIEFAGNGHVDAIAIAGLVLSLAFLERRRSALGAVALAFSIASKYLMVPVAAFAVRLVQGRGRGTFVAAFVLALVFLYLPYLTVIPVGSLGTFAGTFEFNGSVYELARLALSRGATRGVFGIVLLGVLVVLWRRNASPEQAAFVWVAAVLILSPIVHPWYLTWLIPFLAWRREAWAFAWTATIVLAYTVLPDWQKDGIWELPTWVPWAEYAPVAALLLWRLRRGFPSTRGDPSGGSAASSTTPSLTAPSGSRRGSADSR